MRKGLQKVPFMTLTLLYSYLSSLDIYSVLYDRGQIVKGKKKGGRAMQGGGGGEGEIKA